MHILIAPNAFKNSLTATEVSEAIKEGFEKSKLHCTCFCFPIGDGGDGTASLLIRYLNATIVTSVVHDPFGENIIASFGLTQDRKTAIIELAEASGLRLLKPHEYNPLLATTYGTGELIKAAMNEGVEKIILCIGGSATVDGGMGILQALGAEFLDDYHNIIQFPEELVHLKTIKISSVDTRIKNIEVVILCDVENALLGTNGAARIFGPQKGADKNAVEKLETSLTKLRDVVLQQTGKDMATITSGGAAGGVAAGVATLLNAHLVNGIDYFLNITCFDEALQKASLVITGEGSIDEQTLQGKGPYGVAKRAKEKTIPVIGMAGKIPLQASTSLQGYFDVLISINCELSSLEHAIKNTYPNLIQTARTIGNLLSLRTLE
ncbi:MAG: glycerate kinase [Ilyomonas sp.]